LKLKDPKYNDVELRGFKFKNAKLKGLKFKDVIKKDRPIEIRIGPNEISINN
jgi:hypothetical protein